MVMLNKTPSAAGGGIETFISGEALTAGHVLAANASGEVVRATATVASGLFDVVGLATISVGPSTSLPVVTHGGERRPALFAAAPAGASNGLPVFLDTTLGLATLTAPGGSGTAFVRLGILVGANGVLLAPDIIFQPQPLYLVS